jgi:hypothetical protein
VIYTDDMAVKLGLFGIPAVAMIVGVLALNWLDAGPGIAVVVLAFISVSGGVLLGVFADRLPRSSQHRRAPIPRRLNRTL